MKKSWSLLDGPSQLTMNAPRKIPFQLALKGNPQLYGKKFCIKKIASKKDSNKNIQNHPRRSPIQGGQWMEGVFPFQDAIEAVANACIRIFHPSIGPHCPLPCFGEVVCSHHLTIFLCSLQRSLQSSPLIL
jgi:hypothetical protein